MMLFKLKVDELPLPKGLALEALGELYKKYVDEEPPQPSAAAGDASPALATASSEQLQSEPGLAVAGIDSRTNGPAAEEQPLSLQQQHHSTTATAGTAASPAVAAAGQDPAPSAAAAAAAGVPLPSGLTMAALAADQWVYQDPKGNEQGPFHKADILDWFENGFFNLELPIRWASWCCCQLQSFVRSTEQLQICGKLFSVFLSSACHAPMEPLQPAMLGSGSRTMRRRSSACRCCQSTSQ